MAAQIRYPCSGAAVTHLRGGIVAVQKPQAGTPVRFRITGADDLSLDVRFTLERPDGTRERLPSLALKPPHPPGNEGFLGPSLPKDSGGSVLIVEVFDATTGQLHDIGGGPVAFGP